MIDDILYIAVEVKTFNLRAAAGKMVEVCRNAASQAIVASQHDIALRDEFLRWNMAFPVAVKNYLRGEAGRAGELAGVLSSEDIDALLSAAQQPLYCLQMMRFAACEMTSTGRQDQMQAAAQYIGIDNSLQILIGAMNSMERLNTSPLPFAYAAHVRVFLLLFLLLVTVYLQPFCSWLTIPAVTLASFALLGTETAATECERPFKRRVDHLPLERFCLTVADNVLLLLSTQVVAASRSRLRGLRRARGVDAGCQGGYHHDHQGRKQPSESEMQQGAPDSN